MNRVKSVPLLLPALRIAMGRDKLVSEQELVEMLLRRVNSPAPQRVPPTRKRGAREHDRKVQEMTEMFLAAEHVLSGRPGSWLRHALEGIQENPKAVAADLAAGDSFGISAEFQLAIKDGELSAFPVLKPSSDREWIMLALAFLLDRSRPFGRDLRRCRLPDCDKFFLVYRPPTGRPRDRYCRQEHMEEAQRRTLSKRVMDSRRRTAARKAARRPK